MHANSSHYTVYFAVACFVAYFFSGHSGIYTSQRLGVAKKGRDTLPPDVSLREVRELHAVTNGSTFEALTERLPFFSANPSNHETMKDHHIVSREMGKIRIYLTPRDRAPSTGFWDRLNAKPVYRELIKAAKRDGLSNAAAFMTHFGFSNGGKVQTEGAELPNPNLTMCVELIDHKDKLEEFCRKHGPLLKGKTIVYKHVEHWDIRSGEIVEHDASPNEVIDGHEAKVKCQKAKS